MCPMCPIWAHFRAQSWAHLKSYFIKQIKVKSVDVIKSKCCTCKNVWNWDTWSQTIWPRVLLGPLNKYHNITISQCMKSWAQ